MSGHSKEPWHVHHDIDAGEWPMVMAGGAIVANVNPSSFHSATSGFVEMPSKVNAERIVACVNACAGLSTDDLMNTGLVSAVGYQLIEKDAEIEQQQARIAELEAQAAIGRRAIEVVDQALPVWDGDGIDPERHHCELTLLNERHRARAEIFSRLRDAEQASGQGILDSSAPEQANSRVILDSSDHVPGATKMVTDRLRARIAELEAQAAKEPSTVAVDAGALEALRSAMSKLRAPMSRTEYAAARAGIIEAAYRLLAGGGQ